MIDQNPRSTARIGAHPIHPMLVPFPIGAFVGALVTDISYAVTRNPLWGDFSDWLLVAGLLTAVLAALAGVADFLGSRQVRAIRKAWLHMAGNVLAVLLSGLNLLVHFRDGAAGIIPTGLTLSAVVTGLLVVTGWLGGELVYRGRVGVQD